jgi:hypothetical protein
MMSDAESRQARLLAGKLVSVLDSGNGTTVTTCNGTTVTPLGDSPQGYLVLTPDGHVFVQLATRAERGWPGPEVLELSQGTNLEALGFVACNV